MTPRPLSLSVTVCAIAVCALAVACGQNAPKPEPAATATPAPAAPPPIPPVRVFVTNETSGDLTVIDAATQTAITTAPLGKRPRGIQPSPDGKSLYVALSGSPPAPPGTDESKLPPPDRSADGIGEIDADTYKVKRIIHAGADPEQLAVSADGSKLYVANEDTAQISVVDAASGNITATVKIGEEPEGVTIRPDGRLLVLTPAADHLRELLAQTSVGVDARKRERLDRTFGKRFELERRVRVTDRVQLRADAGAALYRMGPWARHEVTPRPLDSVTVAVELSLYRPRSL